MKRQVDRWWEPFLWFVAIINTLGTFGYLLAGRFSDAFQVSAIAGLAVISIGDNREIARLRSRPRDTEYFVIRERS